MLSRRSFMWLTGAAAGLSVTRVSAQRGRSPGGDVASAALAPSIAALTSMRDRARPITVDERRVRIERARKIMAEQNVDAIVLAGGTSLLYFTGIRWGNSERLFAVVIPKTGNPYVVCPGSKKIGHANNSHSDRWCTPTWPCGRKTKARSSVSPRA